MNKSIDKLIEDIFVKHGLVQRLSKDAVTGEVEVMETMDEIIFDLKKEYKIIGSGKVEQKITNNGFNRSVYIGGKRYPFTYSWLMNNYNGKPIEISIREL